MVCEPEKPEKKKTSNTEDCFDEINPGFTEWYWKRVWGSKNTIGIKHPRHCIA